MTTAYTMRTNDEGFPEVKNGSPAFSRPLMLDDKKVFLKAADLAKKLDSNASSVCTAVRGRGTLGGHDVRYATTKEVKAHLKGKEIVEVHRVPHGNKKSQKKEEKEPMFVGVEWPDGRITIRLSAGGDWEMNRASEEEIPKEIFDECGWM
jgi:hypothetical protein